VNSAEDKTTEEDTKPPNFGSILLSTAAAAFGVQSNRNRERDFKNGNIWVFIVAGIVFTGLFVVTVFSIVKTVLSSQGL